MSFSENWKTLSGEDLQGRTSQLGSDTCKCESHRNVRVLDMFACHFLVHVVQSVLQGDKDPFGVVKREKDCKTKATQRTNQ